MFRQQHLKDTCKTPLRGLHGACYDHGSMMPTKRFQ